MSSRGFYSPNDYTPNGGKRKYDFDYVERYDEPPLRRPYRDDSRRRDEYWKPRYTPSSSCESKSIDDEVGHYQGVPGNMIKNRC